MKRISENGITLIKSFEGLRLKAYKAVKTEKYYTIGYGHYGSDVSKDMVITEEQATELLKKDIERFERHVRLYDVYYNFNQNEFDALVSFAFNVGSIKQLTANGTRSRETIKKKMIEYNKSGGNVLNGLVKRRKKELTLFESPVIVTGDTTTNPDVSAIAIATVALDVLYGKYGSGEERKKKLREKGYNPTYIQSIVNLICNYRE